MFSPVMALTSFALFGMLTACVATGSSSGVPSTAQPVEQSGSPSVQTAGACAVFNSRVWAQTVFDADPGANAALDPDDDDLACEDLPAGIAPALWTDEVPANAVPVELIDVTDGDTIVVNVDGRRERVRLVGVDAHETNGPYQEVECYGPQASDFLTRLLGIDAQLWLEQDQEDRDRYGRLLRWVWADFGAGEVYLLNEALVRAGYAERFRNTPNRRYVDEVIAAEVFAQRHQLGLWGFCNTGS
jgi:micrococcal nuclease